MEYPKAANDNHNQLLRKVVLNGVLFSLAVGGIFGAVMDGVSRQFWGGFIAGTATGGLVATVGGFVVYSFLRRV